MYYLGIGYAVRIDCGKTKYYRGIFGCKGYGENKKFFVDVKKAKELKFDEELSVSTLRKYQAEILPCQRACKEALNALLRALKLRANGAKVTVEDIMRVNARRLFPADFVGNLTYERSEIFIGKAKE